MDAIAMTLGTHDWHRHQMINRSHRQLRVFRKPLTCNHPDRTRPIPYDRSSRENQWKRNQVCKHDFSCRGAPSSNPCKP